MRGCDAAGGSCSSQERRRHSRACRRGRRRPGYRGPRGGEGAWCGWCRCAARPRSKPIPRRGDRSIAMPSADSRCPSSRIRGRSMGRSRPGKGMPPPIFPSSSAGPMVSARSPGRGSISTGGSSAIGRGPTRSSSNSSAGGRRRGGDPGRSTANRSTSAGSCGWRSIGSLVSAPCPLNGSPVWPCSTSPASIRWSGGWCHAGGGLAWRGSRCRPLCSSLRDWRGGPRIDGRGRSGASVGPILSISTWQGGSPAGHRFSGSGRRRTPWSTSARSRRTPGSSPLTGRRSSVGTAPEGGGSVRSTARRRIRLWRAPPTCRPPGSPASIGYRSRRHRAGCLRRSGSLRSTNCRSFRPFGGTRRER